MRDSPAHVEAPGGRPQGRLIAVVRHCRGSGVRDMPAAPASKTAVAPTPDPAFSEISSEASATPVTTASYTQTEQVTPVPANSNESAPLIEAF